MKSITLLCLCAALVAQVASAVDVQVQNTQSLGINYTFGTGVSTLDLSGGADFRTNIRNQPASAGKVWMQFDLTSIWTTYGQANLIGATLSIWNANGTGRQFDVAGLADSSGLEGWTPGSVADWASAPANVAASGHAFNSTQIYSGTNIWEVRQPPALGHDVSNPTFTQNARYDSSDYTANDILGFIASDTDGKVTFMVSGSPVNNNQSVYIGPSGTWTAGDLPTLSSPTLTLTFVPEPGTLSVAMLGLGALLIFRRRL